MKIPVYNLSGNKVSDVTLPALFDVAPNHDLLSHVVRVARANARRPWAHAKMRGEIRGGGRKPWRQKGTGRARHGSSRSPIWVGGGVTHGPRNDRVLEKSINKKMKRRALQMALTSKISDDELTIVEGWGERERPKTKAISQSLKAIARKRYENQSAFEKGTLIVISGVNIEQDRQLRLSARNLPWIKVARADSLGVVDLLSYRHIIIPVDTLPLIDEVFGIK